MRAYETHTGRNQGFHLFHQGAFDASHVAHDRAGFQDTSPLLEMRGVTFHGRGENDQLRALHRRLGVAFKRIDGPTLHG